MPAQALDRKADPNVVFGVGIMGMQERVKQLGGHMKVESNNNGTTIQAILPWERMTVSREWPV